MIRIEEEKGIVVDGSIYLSVYIHIPFQEILSITVNNTSMIMLINYYSIKKCQRKIFLTWKHLSFSRANE